MGDFGSGGELAHSISWGMGEVGGGLHGGGIRHGVRDLGGLAMAEREVTGGTPISYDGDVLTSERVAVGDNGMNYEQIKEVSASAKKAKELNCGKCPEGSIGSHILKLRGGGSDNTFIAILKNSRSLVSEERFEEVFAEVSDLKWDALLFNETWREAKEEYDTLHNNHVWLGSGGSAGKHGVGILLNERWAKFVYRWSAVSPRLGILELNEKHFRISIIVVHMPHCGYADEHVEELYEKLSSIVRNARSRKRLLLVAGDWNAEVESGSNDDHTHKEMVGRYANHSGNYRGDMLKRWAMAERMVIANTLFKKRWGLRWTHVQHGRQQLLDYICVDSTYRRH